MSPFPRSAQTFILPFIVLAILVTGHGPSWAASGASSAPIDERQLRAFVKTYVETQNIRREYEPPIEKSKDPERKERLHQGANKELKAALDRNNLTVEQYNRIFAQVNKDKPLRDRVLKLVEEERLKSPGSRPEKR